MIIVHLYGVNYALVCLYIVYWSNQDTYLKNYHFFVMRTFKIFSSSYFELYNTMLIMIILCIIEHKNLPSYLVVILYSLTSLFPFPPPLSRNHYFAFYFYKLSFLKISQMSEIMWYLFFCTWFIWPNVMISCSIHVAINGRILSFIWLHSSQLCMFTT